MNAKTDFKRVGSVTTKHYANIKESSKSSSQFYKH